MAQLDLLPEVFDDAPEAASPGMLPNLHEKSPLALRNISEVAAELDVPPHVLRFWETKFSEIQPVKMKGGRRHYRPEDVIRLRSIQHLLYGEGYTIKGAQAALEQNGHAPVPPALNPLGALDEKTRLTLDSALAELRQMRSILQSLRRA